MFVNNSKAIYIWNGHPVDNIPRLESGITFVKIEQLRNQQLYYKDRGLCHFSPSRVEFAIYKSNYLIRDKQ